MSYDDSSPDGRSMTAYELSLSFNELEPIFDDDYDDGRCCRTIYKYRLLKWHLISVRFLTLNM
jgi:hypothetical protein